MPIFQEIHDNEYELEKDELYDAYKRLFSNLIPTEKVILLNIKKKSKPKESVESSSPFKPEINAISVALATKNRTEGINIEDKLLDQGRAVKSKIEEKQKERMSKETEGCTFSPSINQRHKKEQA
jgi:DNA-binding protein YbaB